MIWNQSLWYVLYSFWSNTLGDDAVQTRQRPTHWYFIFWLPEQIESLHLAHVNHHCATCSLGWEKHETNIIIKNKISKYLIKFSYLLANTTSGVRSSGLNCHFHLISRWLHAISMSFDGNWKLLWRFPQPGAQQPAGTLQVCARSFRMLMQFICARLGVSSLASQRLYRQLHI